MTGVLKTASSSNLMSRREWWPRPQPRTPTEEERRQLQEILREPVVPQDTTSTKGSYLAFKLGVGRDWHNWKQGVGAAARAVVEGTPVNHPDKENVEYLWAGFPEELKADVISFYRGTHPDGDWTSEACDRKLEADRKWLMDDYRVGQDADNGVLNADEVEDHAEDVRNGVVL